MANSRCKRDHGFSLNGTVDKVRDEQYDALASPEAGRSDTGV